MKYKLLMLGKNKAVIDDIFMHLDEDFEAQTTSLRQKDIASHINCFEPDAVVFCLNREEKESIRTVFSFKNRLINQDIPLILIGNEEECTAFDQETDQMSSLVLIKPISTRNVRDKIYGFLENRQQAVKMELEISVPAKKHILVVDDDPMMLKLIKEHLKDSYAVGTAISGSLALKFLQNKKTDMVLLDYEMPEENGASVLEKIRANEETAHLPVVFLTGVSEREKIRKVLELKPQGYLLKPIEREKLLKMINSVLG